MPSGMVCDTLRYGLKKGERGQKMKAIVVADENWAIGKDGGLLIHLPGDLKYFKEKTLGKTVVMGRATLESLPGGKPLPKRRTIVLSGNGKLAERLAGTAETASSVEALLALLEREKQAGSLAEDDVFAAGGETVYRQLLPYCDEVFVTKIQKTFSGADKHFPNLDQLAEWELFREGEPIEENGVVYRFTVYQRRK